MLSTSNRVSHAPGYGGWTADRWYFDDREHELPSHQHSLGPYHHAEWDPRLTHKIDYDAIMHRMQAMAAEREKAERASEIPSDFLIWQSLIQKADLPTLRKAWEEVFAGEVPFPTTDWLPVEKVMHPLIPTWTLRVKPLKAISASTVFTLEVQRDAQYRVNRYSFEVEEHSIPALMAKAVLIATKYPL